MYNFVTTTLINSLTYGKKKENLLSVYNLETAIDGVDNVETANKNLKGFSIKRVRDFYKNKMNEEVLSVYKAAGYDAVLSKATINLGNIWTAAATDDTAGQYRLKLYIQLQGSENPYYANDLVFKGKPFFVEFMVKTGQTAATIAANIKKNADKYIAMVYEDKLLDLEVSGNNLVINATDEHQRFTVVAIEKFKAGIFAMEGAFVPVAELSSITDIDPTTGKASKARTIDDAAGTAGTISVAQGIEGFGTYHHLMKDYRLPTAANRRWIAIHGDETPILGKIYNQYTITYCSDRGNMGTSVIGQPTKSVTTHVFWVANDIADTFEKGLNELGWSADGGTATAAEEAVVSEDPNKDGIKNSKEKVKNL